MTNAVAQIRSASEYKNALDQARQQKPLLALNFWAKWAQPCIQMNDVFSELCKLHGNTIDFLQIEAEEVADISERFDIAAVPCFIIVQKSDGKVLDRIEGANPPELSKRMEKHAKHASIFTNMPSSEDMNTANTPSKSAVQSEEALNARLKALTTMDTVVLFMKGSPDGPKCGFSRQIVELLNGLQVKFAHFDILTDEQVRQGLKKYADWPTYPQLWLNGELVGGLDIVKEMISSGELQQSLGQSESALNDRLKKLINQSDVMVFIKGTPQEPRCGFSRQLIDILEDMDVKFGSFDILSDEQVRQGLKKFSDWPTYPQVYIKGELVGGLDIVREMVESGEFQGLISAASS